MYDIEHINYIKAPVAAVYMALTTAEGLAETWTRKLIVEPAVGFINQFDFDDNYATRMEITELLENKRITWLCTGSDPEWIGTSIDFELEEKDDVTAVRLRQLHWKELTEFYRWCNYNWAMFLYSLKSYCEDGKGMPFQDRKF